MSTKRRNVGISRSLSRIATSLRLISLGVLKRGTRSRSTIIAGSMAAILISTVAIHGSQNPNRSAVSSGGSVAAQSSTHRVSGMIGQVASSRPQSATTTVAEGFWNTVGLCRCDFIGDLNKDGFIDILDVVETVGVAFRNEPGPPAESSCPIATIADVNCDSNVDILDVVGVVSTAFRNTDTRCNPCTD